MEFVNETRLEAGWTLGFQPDGRELLLVAVKATFDITEEGEEPALAKEQAPLTESDEFTGEPGFSATLYESDYAHHKPACDVLLNGSAYPPHGEPSKNVTVGLRIGPVNKQFEVAGDRVWDKVFFSVMPSDPSPFTRLPISYDRAYGGVDTSEKNPDKVRTYLENPVGVGYYPLTKRKALVGKPLPNTHEVGRPVKTSTGKYRPMSFGSIGRNFKCRLPFTGTYDEEWLSERAPFFPDDFDYRYFQSAPIDQQIPYPTGGEEVVLENLTPDRVKRFRLPNMSMPILFVPHGGEARQRDAVIDTVLIEPDRNCFMLTWRASFALRKNCFEIAQAVVGKTFKTYRRETRTAGKTRYHDLEEMIRAKRNKQPG